MRGNRDNGPGGRAQNPHPAPQTSKTPKKEEAMRVQKGVMALAAVAAIMLAGGGQAMAQFYKGKTILIAIPGGPTGSYGVHVKVLEKYLSKHIAGSPSVDPVYMPGAGGLKAANYVYNVAPKDGTYLGTPLKTIVLNEAVKRPGVKFKSEKFGWIISTGPVDSVLAVWTSRSPALTIEDMKKKEVILGSTGKGSVTYIEPTILNQLIGTRFKVITGYKGLEGVHLALERGEVHGRHASWESLQCCRRQWLEQKQITIVAQSGLVRNSDLPTVPTMIELGKTEKDKKFLEFFGAGSTLGRIYVSPPAIPAERLKELRDGFWKAVHDPEYKAAMKKRGLEYHPRTGEEALKYARLVLNADADIIARARKLVVAPKKKK
jgi:tripartite-type tricarboxylate transporter receptor subunit TctC